jgi:IS5 family transposase
MGQPGFFDVDNRLEKLSHLGDPLEMLNRSIPWETFRPVLSKSLRKFKKSNAGRKPYDSVLMFKILVLQSLYNLSDDQTEYMIRDRLSFMRFLGLGLEDPVPDAKTLWLFRETLAGKGAIRKLFGRFNRHLDREGYIARQGQIVDASLVPVPIQRNTREENQQIKQGQTPEPWQDNPIKLRQKDTDARWTRKHGKSYYGYKNHLSADREHKLIRHYEVTDAGVHDSRMLGRILDPDNTGAPVFGDSAYRSQEIDRHLKERNFKNELHYRSYQNRPLSEVQERVNKKRAKIRAVIEHIFAFQENSLGGKFIRTIGLIRAWAKIGMMNLAYNLRRYAYLEKQTWAQSAP